MPKHEAKRSVRVADDVRIELDGLVRRMRDPGAEGIVVTAVRLSDDLRHARVYVRVLALEVDEAAKKKAVAALKRASGHLRRALGARLSLRYVPELAFFWDDVADRAEGIDRALREIERDRFNETATPSEDEKARR